MNPLDSLAALFVGLLGFASVSATFVECQLQMYLDPVRPDVPIDPSCTSQQCPSWGNADCDVDHGGPGGSQIFCICFDVDPPPDRRTNCSGYFDTTTGRFQCERFGCPHPCPTPVAHQVWLDVDGDGWAELVWFYVGCSC